MSETPIDERSYSRGYAAGRRRAKANDQRVAIRAMREEFEREVFLAALPAVIAREWIIGSTKKVTTVGDYSRIAREFADRAGESFNFTPPPAPEREA